MPSSKDLYNWNCKLDLNLTFRGKLKFKGSLYLDSKFEGEIEAEDGILLIGKNSTVIVDNIKCRILILEGTLKGNVLASEKVSLEENCKLYGDIKTKKIYISDGVVFDGKCEMIKTSNSIDLFSATVSQIKEILQ